MVPSSENSAVFCEIGRSWPSQNAQPVGGEVEPEDPDLGYELVGHDCAPNNCGCEARDRAQVWLGNMPNSEMM